jgi:hypothetical protein
MLFNELKDLTNLLGMNHQACAIIVL